MDSYLKSAVKKKQKVKSSADNRGLVKGIKLDVEPQDQLSISAADPNDNYGLMTSIAKRLNEVPWETLDPSMNENSACRICLTSVRYPCFYGTIYWFLACAEYFPRQLIVAGQFPPIPKTNLKLILPFKLDLSSDHDKSIKVYYKRGWSLHNDISLSLNRSTAYSLFCQNGSFGQPSDLRNNEIV